MKLKTMTKSAGEAAAAPATVKEARTAKPPAKAVPEAPSTKKRLVKGKSDRPIMPASGALTLESIIGLDERTRIVETEDAPWRMICALEIDGPFGAFIGTG